MAILSEPLQAQDESQSGNGAVSLFPAGFGSTFVALELKTSGPVDFYPELERITNVNDSPQGLRRQSSLKRVIGKIRRLSKRGSEPGSSSVPSSSQEDNSNRSVQQNKIWNIARALNQLRQRALLPERSEQGIKWIYK